MGQVIFFPGHPSKQVKTNQYFLYEDNSDRYAYTKNYIIDSKSTIQQINFRSYVSMIPNIGKEDTSLIIYASRMQCNNMEILP
jgi:hypothetical protein